MLQPQSATTNMNSPEQVLVLLAIFFIGSECQLHYVPAQILIPTYNYTNNNGYYNYNNNYGNNNNGTNGPIGWSNPNSILYNNSWGSNGSCNRANGHLICGTVGNGDRLLFNQVYFKPRRWYSARDKLVEYPKDVPGGYVRHETIGAIKVYNQYYDGQDATARVKSGGVGYKYVNIELKSSWGKGFRYLVQIFGR